MIPLRLCVGRWQGRELDVEMNLIDFVKCKHLKYGEKVFVFEVEALREVEHDSAVLDIRIVKYLLQN